MKISLEIELILLNEKIKNFIIYCGESNSITKIEEDNLISDQSKLKLSENFGKNLYFLSRITNFFNFIENSDNKKETFLNFDDFTNKKCEHFVIKYKNKDFCEEFLYFEEKIQNHNLRNSEKKLRNSKLSNDKIFFSKSNLILNEEKYEEKNSQIPESLSVFLHNSSYSENLLVESYPSPD